MKKLILLLTVSLLMIEITEGQPYLIGTCRGGGSLNNFGSIFMADGYGNNLENVYKFDSINGANPIGNMIQAPNGKIYGITSIGGCRDSCVLYEFDPTTNTNLDVYDFYCSNKTSSPYDGMILGTDGNLYGLTVSGGTNFGGSIYRFNPDTHIFDTLYNFNNHTGFNPIGRLLLINNKLYGTTNSGGANDDGTLFCFDLSSMNYSDLHDFEGTDGLNPMYGSLIPGNDGKLYGTTEAGGVNNSGVIFSFDLSNDIYVDIYNFDSANGDNPTASLIRANNGLLYGMTPQGGTYNKGVIFSFNITDNTYSDLFNFNDTLGANPLRSLTQSQGLLYGSTYNGGTYNKGVFFSYNIMNNKYNTLYNFDGIIDGGNPDCDILEAVDSSMFCSCVLFAAMNISPNPVSYILSIKQFGEYNNLQIINVLGQVIYKSTFNGSMTTVDVSEWSNGVYVCLLSTSNNSYTLREKFIKQ